MRRIHHLAIAEARHVHKVILKRPFRIHTTLDECQIDFLHGMIRELASHLTVRLPVAGNEDKPGSAGIYPVKRPRHEGTVAHPNAAISPQRHS